MFSCSARNGSEPIQARMWRVLFDALLPTDLAPGVAWAYLTADGRVVRFRMQIEALI